MIDILLATSYFLRYDGKQTAKMQPYPPLATLYVAAHLRSAGYSVALFDATLADGEHEFAAALRQYRPRFVAVYEDSFHFLIKMCLSRMRSAAQLMCGMARESGATVIAAGPDVTDHPEAYFAHGVQYALAGEADNTLQELLDRLTGRETERLAEIAGLVLPDGSGGFCHTPRREPERSLDRFAFPARDLLDVERYRAAWKEAHGYFSINIVSTRGCPFHCNWCAKPIWGQRYAMRSPANVAEEMAELKRTIQPDHLWFTDDIFGLRGAWVAEFGQEVTARDASIPFTIQSRVDLMTDRTVAGLAQAGCAEVWLGAESGSQRILDAMDKGTRLLQIPVARERLKKAGIKTSFFLQFGYPGETFEDIMATVQMVRDTLPDKIGISVSYPLPGTKFYDMVQAQLGDKTHWVDSNDLAMMFQGTYQSPVYRHLHGLLHRDLDLRCRLVDGPADAEALAELDRLNADWLELGRLETQCRSEAPTQLVRLEPSPAPPDLSKEWN